MKANIYSLLILLLTLSSCSVDEDDLVGTWVLKPKRVTEFTKDTLFMYKNHTYRQVLYDSTNKFLFRNENTWELDYKDQNLTLFLFFSQDGLLKHSQYSYSKIAMKTALHSFTLPIDSKNVISLNDDLSIYYYKID